uniref:Uncharacterized protein n=1 Tax=Arundo donax TaxID=35708 RepID=A0A0A9H255_ARUDO
MAVSFKMEITYLIRQRSCTLLQVKILVINLTE